MAAGRASPEPNAGTAMRRYGFTLIELLVVIAVIAVLAALLIPLIGIARKSARDASCQARLGEIKAALSVYKDANGLYPESYGASGGDVYSTTLATGSGPTATGKAAPSIGEGGWQAVNRALKLQLNSVDPGNFRIVAADASMPWKPTGPYINDPYGSSPNDFKVFRYRPARYYPLPATPSAGTIAIDSDTPPNLDSYQLWSCGWNRKDEYGEKLYQNRKGDDQTNWSGK
jgi:prepilin-type N-terminal cleavage/methylation domain-containing protein